MPTLTALQESMKTMSQEQDTHRPLGVLRLYVICKSECTLGMLAATFLTI
jgi:hypothetical protein